MISFRCSQLITASHRLFRWIWSSGFWLLLLLLIGGTPRAVAQSNALKLEVIHAATTSQDEGVALSVFFAIKDGTGRPIPRPNFESTNIQLLSSGESISAPTPADFSNPQTPIYIALLLDTGGSTSDAVAYLKEAAKAAVDQAPPNASIAVFPFSDVPVDQELRPLSNFATGHDLVKRDIDLVQAQPGGPSCIYNALYKAIEALDSQIQNPQDRRAIILFTDGRDESQPGVPCGGRTYYNVIARALNDPNKLTPIFTIGLQEGATELNSADLIAIAEATRAYYAIGGRNDLSALYRVMMDSLYSQVVAQATVFPRKGQNSAVLRVKIAESDTPLAATFTFDSDRDFVMPTATGPVDVQINGIGYDPTANAYNVSVSVSNPDAVGQLVVQVNSDSGLLVGNVQFYEPKEALIVTVDGNNLTGGQEYAITILAEDHLGQQMMKPKDNLSRDSVVVQAQHKFKAQELPTPEPPKVSIDWIKPEWESNRLLISLIYPTDAQFDDYWVTIIEEESSLPAYTSPAPQLLNGQAVIEIPIPDSMRLLPVKSYIINVYFELKDGSALSEPVTKNFTPPIPPQVSTLERVWKVVSTERWVQVAIAVILFCGLGTLLLTKLWPKKAKELPPLPINSSRIEIGAVGGVNVRPAARPTQLRVKLISSPNQLQKLEKVITHFPCEIGRHENCDVNLSIATPDKRISRHHIKVTAEKDGLFLVDLGSDNGTFMNDKRLRPETPFRLDRTTVVRLGPETTLELRPEGGS